VLKLLKNSCIIYWSREKHNGLWVRHFPILN